MIPCEICRKDASAGKGGCTNRRCRSCHQRWCTPGGITYPGHGRRWPEPTEEKEGTECPKPSPEPSNAK